MKWQFRQLLKVRHIYAIKKRFKQWQINQIIASQSVIVRRRTMRLVQLWLVVIIVIFGMLIAVLLMR